MSNSLQINQFDTFPDEPPVVVNPSIPGFVVCCCVIGVERDALVRGLNYHGTGSFKYIIDSTSPQPQPCDESTKRKHFVMKEQPVCDQ
jgi:hypothetical protein